jgi:hypothetical protein
MAPERPASAPITAGPKAKTDAAATDSRCAGLLVRLRLTASPHRRDRAEVGGATATTPMERRRPSSWPKQQNASHSPREPGIGIVRCDRGNRSGMPAQYRTRHPEVAPDVRLFGSVRDRRSAGVLAGDGHRMGDRLAMSCFTGISREQGQRMLKTAPVRGRCILPLSLMLIPVAVPARARRCSSRSHYDDPASRGQ